MYRLEIKAKIKENKMHESSAIKREQGERSWCFSLRRFSSLFHGNLWTVSVCAWISSKGIPSKCCRCYLY